MIQSMTGIGEARITEDNFDIGVLIKSINHKYLQINVRLPKAYNQLDNRVRRVAAQFLDRGRVDIYVDLYVIPSESQEFIVNEGLVEKFLQTASQISQRYKLRDDLTVSQLFRMSDFVFNITKPEFDDLIWSKMENALRIAFEDFNLSRNTEGERLQIDLRNRLNHIKSFLKIVENFESEQCQEMQKRLESYLDNLSLNGVIEKNRLEQEFSLMVVKADISEEIVRLNSHVNRMENLLNTSGNIGKKGEFILQEMLRETNTLGSKCVLQEITDAVIELKVIIEKMREQFQNIQ